MMSDLTILHKIVIQTELMNKRRSVQGILQVLCLLCCICVHNLCVLGTVFAYITDLEDQKVVASSDKVKANLLAHFFVEQRTDNNRTTIHVASELHCRCISPTSTQVVLHKLLPLLSSKAVDGNITNCLLKAYAPFLPALLLYLFSLSLNTCCFLSVWKCAVETPLFKNRESA